MRQKEAAEAERKAAARALEKSQKTVDRFTEAEKLVSTKLVSSLVFSDYNPTRLSDSSGKRNSRISETC